MSDPAIGETLVSSEDLQRRVAELGAEISRDYEGRDLVMVGVLKGAVLFLADLMRHIDVPCEIDFMAVSSYGSQTDSSGVVRILKDLDAPIEGRHVLIVEDIIDSGLTLQYLMRNLKARRPASLEVCALLTKPERLRVDLSPRYVGFEIPNRFAIGYGLDHAQRYRNLDYVAALAELSAQNRPGTLIFTLEAFFQKRGISDPAGGHPGVRRPASDQRRLRPRAAALQRADQTENRADRNGQIEEVTVNTKDNTLDVKKQNGEKLLDRLPAQHRAEPDQPARSRTTSKTDGQRAPAAPACSRCSPTSCPSSSSSASGSS